MSHRLQKLRKLFPEYGIDALIVSNPVNCFYLSGFTGSSATLLIDGSSAFLLTDFRYIEQAGQQSPNFEVIEVKEKLPAVLNQLICDRGVNKAGVEADYITYQYYNTVARELSGIQVVPTTGMIQKLRIIKDAGEVNLIGESMQLLDEGFSYITGKLQPGKTEKEISLDLEFFCRRMGAEEKAFQFIVASGPRSSMPHGTATHRVMREGELVTIDFGCVYKGYNSDMTRTVVLGEPDDKQREIYNIVLKAQLAALESVKPGTGASEVDNAARSIIESHGYGRYFGHGAGHGVGLEVHEEPRVSGFSNTMLEEGMVLTVEPGIYIPEWSGVRVEDTVVVEKDGCRILCSSKKDKLYSI